MKKSKKVKKSNSWKIKQHRDQFFKKSKTLGYRSRASFKLIELNKKYQFIKNNSNLLDLGSYPGGWTQVASKLIKTGKIMSIDVKDMEPVKNVKFIKGDILEKKTKDEISKYFKGNLNVIISDMAADTSAASFCPACRTPIRGHERPHGKTVNCGKLKAPGASSEHLGGLERRKSSWQPI